MCQWDARPGSDWYDETRRTSLVRRVLFFRAVLQFAGHLV